MGEDDDEEAKTPETTTQAAAASSIAPTSASDDPPGMNTAGEGGVKKQSPLNVEDEEIVVEPAVGRNVPTEPTPAAAAAVDIRRPAPIFPEAFYCPLTKELMKDPVVDMEGDSYERAVITARDGEEAAARYYPNRALKTIIQKAISLESRRGSFRGAFHDFNDSIRAGWKQILEKSAIPSMDFRPLPDALYCPITCDLMYEPVIDSDGNTFEKVAVVDWIRVNGNSPVTRNPMSVTDLRPNHAITDFLDDELMKSEGSQHPSIRRWRAGTRPTSQTPSGASPLPQSTESEPAVTGGTLPTATVTTTTTIPTQQTPYPTTPEELAERRRRIQRKSTCTIIAVLFIGVVLVMGVPYAGWLMVAAIAAVIFCCVCDKSH